MLTSVIGADLLETAWVIIPATGVGVRAGTSYPKQYQKLNNKYILNYTIDIFKDFGFKNILIILNSEDNFFHDQSNIHANLDICTGGETRYLSVYSGLDYLAQKKLNKNTWVLVHDAVRPCLNPKDLIKLISSIINNNIIPGGILATPVTNTLKYSDQYFDSTIVSTTVSRHNLWEALTPQMFKLGLLEQAYENIKTFSESQKNNITDEAYLIEQLGLNPMIIPADFPNPKFTFPQDLSYINYLLKEQKC